MKRIAVLTSGGDAPGMNACIRAVVRTAIYNNLEVIGVERGYNGLVFGNMFEMSKRSVSDIIQRGGTILKTARSKEFTTKEGRERAYQNIKNFKIDGLVVIGGDGSMRGCNDLYKEYGVPSACLPGTIDNDMAYTDFTIGFDTAVNTVLSAINNLRDTMTSHDRMSIVEVMGRRCGDIALYAGLAGGAEIIVTPEMKISTDKIIKELTDCYNKGKTSDIIVFAEGAGDARELRDLIIKNLNVGVKITTLGHIQRGGTPTMFDRILAARLGYRAVTLLLEGKTNMAVGIKDNQVIEKEIMEAVQMKKKFDIDMYKIAQVLSI